MTSSDTTETDSPSNPDLQSPQPSPRVTAPLLGVRNPFSRPPIPSTTPSSGEDSSAAAGDPVDELGASGPTRSSKTEGAVKVDTKSLRDIARGAVLQVSRYVNGALARPEINPEEEELWIAREEDQRQIGDPLANLVGRKGLGEGVINADVANLIESAIGVAAYLVFHTGKAWNIRRAAKRLARLNGAPTRHDTGDPA